MTGSLRLIQFSFVPAEGKSDKQDVYKSLETKKNVPAKSAEFSANIQAWDRLIKLLQANAQSVRFEQSLTNLAKILDFSNARLHPYHTYPSVPYEMNTWVRMVDYYI